MADNPVDHHDSALDGAGTLLARAAAADVRAHRRLAVAAEDFFLPEDARLDERTRSALTNLLRALVSTVEGELRDHGARLLAGRGEAALARALSDDRDSVLPRLMRSGLLRDPALMHELLARVGQELLGNALPMLGTGETEQPSLINRFVQHPDRVVAASAMAVLIAESRRRALPEAGPLTQTDLPAALHRQLIWWVAAALRERLVAGAQLAGRDGLPALDAALSDAAQRSLSASEEGDRLEAAAMRLAAAVDARPHELSALLVEALGDRRIVLFIALTAHGLNASYDDTRALVLDAGAERLWLVLRALELGRDAIAQIGYALSEADPRRNLEEFADTLDAIAAVTPDAARGALATLRLHADYRAAMLALERAGDGE